MIYPSNRISLKRNTKPWYHVVVRDYQDEVIRVCSYQSRSQATKRARFFCNKDTFATVCVNIDPWANDNCGWITIDEFSKENAFTRKCKVRKNNRNKYKIVSPHFEKPCFYLGKPNDVH